MQAFFYIFFKNIVICIFNTKNHIILSAINGFKRLRKPAFCASFLFALPFIARMKFAVRLHPFFIFT